MVSLLLERGASPDPVDDKGDTPLLRALSLGKMKAARVLIKNGAKLDQVNQHGLTPLLRAVLSSTVGAVSSLIEEGAVVDLCAEFSPDYNEDDPDYRNFSDNDSRVINGLPRIVDNSDAWVNAVRPERKDFVNLLLRSDFFPRPCLAIAAWERTTVFRLLVKESGTFPRGPIEVGALRTAIQKSRAIAKRLVSDWQWPLTVRIF
ncbi:hypothetical protein BJX68DRAFT_269906 [Aspergillus pseudodeflectus]|uniref:Ankyrin repeat-containing domain protein n=1 Tax=Aspergillus pseudodeflectus TaxID=176178 RepID=A0ABR4JVG6_9EURO